MPQRVTPSGHGFVFEVTVSGTGGLGRRRLDASRSPIAFSGSLLAILGNS
jgi:hypothetical protein